MITAWSFLVQSVGMSYLPTASRIGTLPDLCHGVDCHTVTERRSTWHRRTGWFLFQLVRPYELECASGDITNHITIYTRVGRQMFEGRAGHRIRSNHRQGIRTVHIFTRECQLSRSSEMISPRVEQFAGAAGKRAHSYNLELFVTRENKILSQSCQLEFLEPIGVATLQRSQPDFFDETPTVFRLF